MNIMLIEDNPADVLLMQEALRELRVDANLMEILSDGISALHYFQAYEVQPEGVILPSLIFLDLNLPGVNGLELLRLLKEHPVWRRIPVIIFSTSASQDDIDACYALWANSYIPKPLTFEELVETVKQILSFWELAHLPNKYMLPTHSDMR